MSKHKTIAPNTKRNKRVLRIYIGAGLLLGVIAILLLWYMHEGVTEVLEAPPREAVYRQATASISDRVEDLLSRMTLTEKVGQMALVEKDSVRGNGDITEYGIGALLSGAGATPEENTAQGWSKMIREFTDASTRTRLGIPVLYGVDAIHGHANLTDAVIFPHSIGLGATHDAELVEQVAHATAQELKATGVRWSFSPTLDMPEDVRWGRTYETFSDDPTLVAKLGVAYVRGLQIDTDVSKSSSTLFIASTLKHYIGAGGMGWNTSSNKNFHIDQGMTLVDEKKLREHYLPPFAAAVNARAATVMVGLNSWGDTKLAAEQYLITDVLKKELGFAGVVVSDWYGVYEIPGGEYVAAVKAINAGVDMVMLPFDYKTFIKNVSRGVKNGDISESRIDDAVRRILSLKFALGLFDDDTSTAAQSEVGTVEHRALARSAVAKSMVLLKNDQETLPLSASVRHVRVAGSSADNVGRQTGAWTVEWQGIDGNWLPKSSSVLSGIKARAGDSVYVEYEPFGNFGANAERADIGIAVVGESPYAEGWGDTANPSLSAEDIRAIQRLKETCDRVIVIIVSGRPLMISKYVQGWDALVAAWLPGSEGGGVADVLFGDVPFTGVLPLPWPDHVGQLPIDPHGITADGTKPLFPRYFGLK